MRIALLASFVLLGPVNDGYQFADCDDDGRFYRRPVHARPGGDPVSLMRVAIHTSETGMVHSSGRPTASGLAVLTNSLEAGARGSNHMYRFDGLGNLHTE